MSTILNKLLKDISSQKQKYHEKLLSPDGEWSLFMRGFQVYDFIIDISNLLIPEFYFASMSGVLLFGLDLTEIEPLSIEFTWRPPTPEEWERGVSVVLERVTSPYAVALEEFIKLNIREEYVPQIRVSRPGKAYYDQSYYGYSYYDPVATREFFRSTLQLLFKKHPADAQRRLAFDALVESLGVNREVAVSVYNRFSATLTGHTECFMLGYGVLGATRLCRGVHHSPELGVVPFIDYEGAYREVNVLTLDHLQYGFILGITPLGHGYLLPLETIYRPLAPAIRWGLEERLRRFRSRVMLTAPALSNYVRGDEAVDHTVCERTNVWGELLSDRYVLEHVVEATLSQVAPGLDPMKRRAYISAVLQLWGHRGKRHRWGYRIFRVASPEDFKSWWLEYWSSQGLDRSVLEELYRRVEPFLERYIQKKVELGRKIRLQRLGVPID